MNWYPLPNGDSGQHRGGVNGQCRLRIQRERRLLGDLLRALHVPLAAIVLLITASGAQADSQPSNSPLSSDWGIGFMTCAGSTPANPAMFKVANPWTKAEILASGIVKCVDDGDAYVYIVDYINFALSPNTDWPSAHLEWLGAGVQKSAPTGGRPLPNVVAERIRARFGGAPEWIYDEVARSRCDQPRG